MVARREGSPLLSPTTISASCLLGPCIVMVLKTPPLMPYLLLGTLLIPMRERTRRFCLLMYNLLSCSHCPFPMIIKVLCSFVLGIQSAKVAVIFWTLFQMVRLEQYI